MDIRYKIYNPAGNITALVIGDNYTTEEKRKINSKIMEKEKTVEQVGFISETEERVTMAGGEFCGNATRSAVKYYLEKQKTTNIDIKINNYNKNSGIKNNKICCEIQIPQDSTLIEKRTNEITQVNLSGITIILLDHENNMKLKEKAIELIEKLELREKEAVGIIFKEKSDKIIPVVWVKEINTLFEENSCGSGSIAYALAEASKSNRKKFEIMQPSGKTLIVEITKEGKVILSGEITEEKEDILTC